MPDTLLYDLARKLLDAVVAGFADHGVALPTNRYVSNGSPAFDCSQVTVNLQRVFSGSPGAETQGQMGCGPLSVAEFSIDIVRCIPSMDDGANPPSDKTISASAKEIYTDLWILRLVVVEAWRNEEFGKGLSFSVRSAAPLDPSGGMGGSELLISVQVI